LGKELFLQSVDLSLLKKNCFSLFFFVESQFKSLLNALLCFVMDVFNKLFLDLLGTGKSNKPNMRNQTNIETIAHFIEQNQLCFK
jgi:hypothetical protein